MCRRWAHVAPHVFVLSALLGTLPRGDASTALAVAAIQTTAGTSATTVEDRAGRVHSTQLMEDVRALSAPELEGRSAGTPGSRRAQAFILKRFKDLGLEPIDGSYEQTFWLTRSRGQGGQPSARATNLFAMIPGRAEAGEFILLTAHYDHLGTRGGRVYPGADDNASGVAGMLAIATWFAANPPRRSIAFVAFDAEEQGLQGSRHFVANPPIALPRIAAIVNLDMIGRGDDNTIHVAGTRYTPALAGPVRELAARRKIRVVLGHDRSGPRGMDDWTQLSDHGPFHSAGIPFLYFGVEDHADYHRPGDTADKIPAGFFQEAVEFALDTVRRLSDMPVVPRGR